MKLFGLTWARTGKGWQKKPCGYLRLPKTSTTGDGELLKITPEGFYVRGARVPQDAEEAQIVYNAFDEFLHLGDKNV
jgi:hypothetical protein